MSLEVAYGGLVLPKGYGEITKVFGNPRDAEGHVPLADFVTTHIVECHAGESGPRGRPPMPGLERFYFQCHRLAEPIMRRLFELAAEVAPGYVKVAASFVPRRMRHDTPERAAARHYHPPLLPLSTHTWGIAVDINSDDNEAVQDFPHEPWSPEWNKRYPRGIPRELVEAMESLGFACGIRWPGYRDPMHGELVFHHDGVHPHEAAAIAAAA